MSAVRKSTRQASASKKKEKEKSYVYNSDQLEQEIRDINDELSVPPSCSRNICSYTTKHAYTKIQKELTNLQTKGYSFILDSNKKPFFQNAHNSYEYQIKRTIKLRFKCKNNRCPQFKREEENDHMYKWTTYYGIVVFSFYFEQIPNKIPNKLRINLKIYGQKCQICNQWGSSSIIEPDLFRLARLYSIIVEIVMHQRLKRLDNHDLEKGIKLKDYERQGKDPVFIPRVSSHRWNLCQACNKKVCLYFYLTPSKSGRGASDYE